MKLQITMPGMDEPGFLRRARQASVFRARLLQESKDPSPALFDEMVEFLLPYITEPTDKDAARDALWDASATQFSELMAAFNGKGEEAVPPPSGESLENTSS